jgi:CheY-like chemotaxis protein
MPRDIATGLELGFFRYLTKPIKVKELMNPTIAPEAARTATRLTSCSPEAAMHSNPPVEPAAFAGVGICRLTILRQFDTVPSV